MAETAYPERQRCKTCRKGFNGTVIAGLYCSYRCGKFPAPAKTIDEAPRGCKRAINGEWGYKTRYNSIGEVPEKYRKDPSTNIYLCDNCRQYHIGHSRPEETVKPEQLSRYVRSYEELASVIKRYMEQHSITNKELAASLKVPAIRVKEIVEANPKASMVVLFKVLDKLRLRVEIRSLS